MSSLEVVCSVSGTQSVYTGLVAPNETLECIDGVPYTRANQYKSGASGSNILESKLILFTAVLLLLSCFAMAEVNNELCSGEIVLH
ncbi:CIC11C00000002796 [Sungouiella intermedia]|uniref:CIC11C00000002796 n=1 Tax=Sungouiella intermedia TaxID=45354 RepID=A0A1L0G8Y7_9ASCO|nr:CIC11C00000002796 [[Candida] intermedia]